MTAKDDTIIFTGGTVTPNKIEIFKYSSVAPLVQEQISYSYQLNLPRFAHCSTVFTHPSYGSVAAVIGGIRQDYVAVEYIFLDDLTRAPIEDETAINSAPSKTYSMSCVNSPTDDGFYMLGGNQDGVVTDAIWKFQCESTGDCAWEKVQTLAKARTNFAAIPIPDDKVDEVLDCS